MLTGSRRRSREHVERAKLRTARKGGELLLADDSLPHGKTASRDGRRLPEGFTWNMSSRWQAEVSDRPMPRRGLEGHTTRRRGLVATLDDARVESHPVTRRERIAFLLDHFHDVLDGVRDRGSGGDHIPLMCRAWNAPSYQELERLLPLLGRDVRPFYRAVVGTYVYPRFVRRAVCPKCRAVKAPALVGELHTHAGRKSSAFVARMVRVPLYPVEQRDVDGAIVWFDDHWIGEPYVPDELLPLVAVA